MIYEGNPHSPIMSPLSPVSRVGKSHQGHFYYLSFWREKFRNKPEEFYIEQEQIGLTKDKGKKKLSDFVIK